MDKHWKRLNIQQGNGRWNIATSRKHESCLQFIRFFIHGLSFESNQQTLFLEVDRYWGHILCYMFSLTTDSDFPFDLQELRLPLCPSDCGCPSHLLSIYFRSRLPISLTTSVTQIISILMDGYKPTTGIHFFPTVWQMTPKILIYLL